MEKWVFLKTGTFADEDDVGRWMVRNGILILNYEDYDDVEYYIVEFKNANEIYLMYDGDESAMSVDYDAILLRRTRGK